MAKYAGNDIYDPVNKAGGTLLFQAPEQALSVAYSKPVDVWAWGFLMFYLLTYGQHPVYHKNFKINDSKMIFFEILFTA